MRAVREAPGWEARSDSTARCSFVCGFGMAFVHSVLDSMQCLGKLLFLQSNIPGPQVWVLLPQNMPHACVYLHGDSCRSSIVRVHTFVFPAQESLLKLIE
jgi:hypothetical protein